MKLLAALIAVAAGVVSAGCAAQPPAQTATARVASPRFTPEPATALAFDPPISSQVSPELIARGPREPSAFVGFQQLQVEYYDKTTADEQYIDDSTQGYDQQSTSERVGVTYR